MADEGERHVRRSPLLPPPTTLAPVELDRVLADHNEWISSSGTTGHPIRLFNVTVLGADFSGRDLSSARFELCDLPQARFRGCTLKSTWLHSCDLDHADFADAIAPKAQFLSSILTGALFTKAMLDEASFLFAKLNGADLSHTSLRKADFEDSEFHEAKFVGANICGVNLARWFLDERQILGAIGNDKTNLPKGFTVRTADGSLLVQTSKGMLPAPTPKS